MNMSDQNLEHIYYECVKAVTSYILQRHWYPNNNERGYIERSWREGRAPDELVIEFVKQYGDLPEDTAADGDTTIADGAEEKRKGDER
jgi:hypothetical protein